VIFHLVRQAGMAPDEVETLLNRGSGLKGLCGENDLRSVAERAAAGDADARLAIDVYCHRIRKYVGAYTAVLGGLDALVFTAGVGENASGIRAQVCRDLEVLGIEVDAVRNEGARASSAPGGVVAVQAGRSRVAVLVAATDEEREIAESTLATVAR
jgi:acetate kinase